MFPHSLDPAAKVSYRGRGAYFDVSKNQLIVGSQEKLNDQMRISMAPDETGDIIFEHTEYIQQITAVCPLVGGVPVSSPFKVDSFPINAALEGTFPFLAQLAANFAMFEFDGLIFQYKPNTGEGGGASKQIGKVVMATDYDPDAFEFTNMQAMENYAYSNSAKTSQGLHHGVECSPKQRPVRQLYTRTSQLPPGPTASGIKDKSFTDLGIFQIATQGVTPSTGGTVQETVNVGELWVTYRIKLSRAQLKANQQLSLGNFDSWQYTLPASASAPSSLTQLSQASMGGLLEGGYGAVTGAGATQRQWLKYTFPESIVAGTYIITFPLHNDTMLAGIGGLHCSLIGGRYIATQLPEVPLLTEDGADIDLRAAGTAAQIAYAGMSGVDSSTGPYFGHTHILVSVDSPDGTAAKIKMCIGKMGNDAGFSSTELSAVYFRVTQVADPYALTI